MVRVDPFQDRLHEVRKWIEPKTATENIGKPYYPQVGPQCPKAENDKMPENWRMRFRVGHHLFGTHLEQLAYLH